MKKAVETTTASASGEIAKHLNNRKVTDEAKMALDGEVLHGFAYEQLDLSIRTKVRKAAQAIHANLRRIEKDFLDNGRKLLAVKDDLGHGHFGPWLHAEFQWSVRTAQNYMAVAERFADDYQHVSYLPSQTIYALAAKNTAKNVVAEVINAAKQGRPMSRKDVETALTKTKGRVAGLAAVAQTVPKGEAGTVLDTSSAKRRSASEGLLQLIACDHLQEFMRLATVAEIQFPYEFHAALTSLQIEAA